MVFRKVFVNVNGEVFFSLKEAMEFYGDRYDPSLLELVTIDEFGDVVG